MLTVHSLTLDHVAGVDHAHVELPDTGVVVIHGPNESGKSTLLTAFRLLLDDVGVSSRAARVRALKSVTVDEPTTVSADLTVAGHRLTVLKSFNRGGGRCELTVRSPRPESLTGRRAEERFAELLAQGVDTGLTDALVIEQGKGLDILAAAGIRSLEQALGAEVTSDDGIPAGDGGRAGELIDRIGAEYARYRTPGGRPARELSAAVTAFEDAGAAHTAAEERCNRARNLTVELERLNAEKAAVLTEEPTAVEEATAAAQALAEGKAAMSELDRYSAAVTVARGARDLAAQRLAAREARVRDVREAEETVNALAGRVDELAGYAEEEKTAADSLGAALTAARVRSRVAAAWAAWLKAVGVREEIRTRIGELADRTTRAEEVARRIREIGETVKDNPVTDTVLENLRTADAELRQAVTVRDAVATTVVVNGPKEGTVTVDGTSRSLPDGAVTLHATGRRDIGVGDYTVSVIPARDVHEVGEDVDRAEEELSRLLAEAGVSDVAEAEDMAGRRRRATEEHREASLRLAQVTGGMSVTDLREALAREELRESESTGGIDSLLARVRDEDPDGTVTLPGVPDGDPETAAQQVTATVAGLETVAESSAKEVEDLREELDRVTRSGAGVRLEAARAELGRARENLRRLSETLEVEREQIGDTVLYKEAEDAGRDLTSAEEALALAKKRVGDVDTDTLAALADGAAARVRRLRERAGEIGHAVSRVTGALGQHAGAAEAVETTRAELERARRRLRQVERRAEAAALLYHEVRKELVAARQRYQAPLREAVERLARTLYGAPAGIDFGDDLGVTARTLDGTTLDTGRLSGGAREQLAVLTRLAVADLVGGGDGVPVIIDDALGFSDRGRAGRMNVVLDKLGKNHQIIVLTCDVNRFDSVPGASFVPMEQVLQGKGIH